MRIKWYDLIPVFSYVILRGKCRGCGEKISIKYPLIELLTALLFLVNFNYYGMSMDFVKYAFLIAVLIVIGIIDYETTDVYFKISLTGIIGGIIFAFFGYYLGGSIMDSIWGAITGGGVIALIIILTRGMGWGDFEICLMCGLYFGLKQSIVMLFFSFVFGGVVSVFLILLKVKKRGDYIPFGPFIAAAAIFTIFFGERILSWYLSTL
jgi:leader peptidase (prepilin peptidase)/N-methyltransferase